MLDDITEQNDDETLTLESTPRLKWYMLDTEKSYVKVWDFIITSLIIYSLFITPYIMVFPCVYSCFLCEKICESEDGYKEFVCFEKYDIECIHSSS